MMNTKGQKRNETLSLPSLYRLDFGSFGFSDSGHANSGVHRTRDGSAIRAVCYYPIGPFTLWEALGGVYRLFIENTSLDTFRGFCGDSGANLDVNYSISGVFYLHRTARYI